MIGIFIGIAAVVALISLGQGLQQAINNQFSLIGADKLFVTGKGGFGPPGSDSAGKLDTHDLKIIRKSSGVESVAGRVFNSLPVEFNDKQTIQFVASMPDDLEGMNLIEEVELFKIDKGRFLRLNDQNNAVVGANYLGEGLFGKGVNLGNSLLIKDQKFKVVGILKKTGDPGIDSGIVISEEKLRGLINRPEEFNAIMLKIKKSYDPSKVAEEITKLMRDDRNQKKDKEDFQIQTPEQLLQSFNTVLNIVQVVLVGIAAISLVVGGIGIMNTMYTSVLERTREIGIMKAVGAKNKDVLLIMLFESGLLGLTGGLIGIMIGAGLSKTVEYVATQAMGTTLIQAHLSPWLLFGALLFSFGIGTLSGLMPARRAANMEPVDALRYE
ncbi:ABC transporter permease [Candidatus Woesearchaeota archaeon]|nr:ABC transporter permease [Candidatus Woesearchaeota archaeon]